MSTDFSFEPPEISILPLDNSNFEAKKSLSESENDYVRESPCKKTKVDAENTDSDSEHDSLDDTDSESDEHPVYKDRESECFDIHEPKVIYFSRLYPFNLLHEKNKQRMEFWANYAIFIMNEQIFVNQDPSKCLQLKEVVRVATTPDPCRAIFMTFQAEDRNGVVFTYEAKMQDLILEYLMQVEFCRERGSDKKVIPRWMMYNYDSEETKYVQSEDDVIQFEDVELKERFNPHFEQMKKSKSLPLLVFAGTLYPVDLRKKEEFRRVEFCAKYALFHYTAKEESKPTLQFKEIVDAIKSATSPAQTYYITFKAEDTMSSNKEVTFYAQVFDHMSKHYLKLGFCRDASGNRVVPRLRDW
ncbi:unnamed protein product [Cuscuta epithymum]|uniref:Uncharacterized protein n=1 Tax=Cuscuta epithymum TaxID=186058 RepID=A0AAV0FYU5_9ASTE|nr:unnamed protein product [Cuscuta epithymum]